MWADNYTPPPKAKSPPKKVLKKFRALLSGGPGAGLTYTIDMPTETIMFPVMTRAFTADRAVYRYEWTDSEGLRHYYYEGTVILDAF